MGKLYGSITPELGAWLQEQRMFFVASSPLAVNGLINCSPKGMDTFRILGPHRVAYLDLTGSGVETIAHLRENGRIVFMFCAFAGPPKIVRLHGTGEIILPGSAEWNAVRSQFPQYSGARAIICASLNRIADSCGFAVPKFNYVAERDTLVHKSEAKGDDGLREYRNEKNARSLDGLSGLEPER